MKKPIGILGGTFDPIHLGHIQLAKEIYRLYDFETIKLIPCNQNALKQSAIATAEQRLRMVELAIEGIDGLTVDDREIRQSGPSYTIDTIQQIRREIGDQALCLIMGTDTFVGLAHWKQWQQLIDYAHFLVGYRPGFRYQAAPQLMTLLSNCQTQSIDDIYRSPAGKILFLDLPKLFDVAATDIRDLLLKGQSPNNVLPLKVQAYIKQHHLY